MRAKILIERVVIKIGGATLFQTSGFEAELRSLLANYENTQIWILVGGGDLVEAMRTAHKIYPVLDHEEMHWRCVELLDYTWNMARDIFTPGVAIANRENLDRCKQFRELPEVYWVRVQSFYNRFEREGFPDWWRPESSWNTTTDALAWLLAKIIDADRVILLKQCDCEALSSLDEAANRGVIDSELARLYALDRSERPIVEFVSSKLNTRS